MQIKVINKGKEILNEKIRDFLLSSESSIEIICERKDFDLYDYGEPWEIRIEVAKSPEGVNKIFVNSFLANEYHECGFIGQRENLFEDIEVFVKLPIGNDDWHKLDYLKKI